MLIAYVPLFSMLIGGAVYFAARRPEVKELARLLFACALLVLLWHLSGATLRIG